MEKKSVKLTFDEGRKSITLDKRAIRKATSKEAWIKDVIPAVKDFGVPQGEIEAKLTEEFDAVRAEADKEVKIIKK